jgi:TDG/mug DNA glycosylase family protein
MITYQIGYRLKILFVGSNPHPGSYRRSVPFSNNKMLWYLLHDAGLLSENRELLRDDSKLKDLYLHAFKDHYKFGLYDVVHRPTRTTAEVEKPEAEHGAQRLLEVIQKYKPKVVCFVSKATYGLFSGSLKTSYGWQPDIGISKAYMMHAPHRGFASVRIEELTEIKSFIKNFKN